ncbi:MAG: chorismate synthase [Spirochaetia bacterium]|nr:chorismate synthase [Spirochaetia bacterium]
MLRYMTAGESHGKGLSVIIDGVPSGLELSEDLLEQDLSERQKGYGRGGRQKIESDRAEIISGVRFGKTTGAPVALFIKNRDFENWKKILSAVPVNGAVKEFNVPRPGHADLAGGIKYGHKDFRNVLERASARETASRVAVGAVAKAMLKKFGVDIFGYVSNIAGIVTDEDMGLDIEGIKKKISEVEKKYKASLRFPGVDEAASIIRMIDNAIKEGDTVGGVVKVITSPLPAGLGDYTQWDKKLDARIAMALMSVQAFKGVEFGLGFRCSGIPGSLFHDRIRYKKGTGFIRPTDNAGGLEGGMTNGAPLMVQAAMKPISTVRKGTESVNAKTKNSTVTVYERSDTCAVPAASVVAEAVVAIEVCNAFMEKFGGDRIEETVINLENYAKYLKKY